MNLKDRFVKFNKDIKVLYPLNNNSKYIYIDLFFSAILFGASFDDYIRYMFWKKSYSERNTFVTYRRSKKIIKKYNLAGNWKILSNKAEFNSFFHDYIKRNWIYLKDASEKEFADFINKNQQFFVKSVDGGQGKDVKLLNANGINASTFLDKHRNCILEQTIVQHDNLKALNPSSCNTIRVYTFYRNGEVSILSCELKTGGKASCVDNLHSGGLCATVDVDTGVVITKGINYQYQREIFHPVTGEQLIGIKIPNWEIVIETAKECAELINNVAYIGWDIAVTPDGCEVIEGNHDPGHGLMQMADQVGKYSLIKEIIRKSE